MYAQIPASDHFRRTATYLGRIAAWRFPTAEDHRRFPTRTVAASAHPFAFPEGAATDTGNLDRFLEDNDTTSLIVVRDGTIIRERYFAGCDARTPLAASSATTSIVSALVGIALQRGQLQSVKEPVTQYLPELETRGFSRVTLEHLLTMTAGLAYSHRPVPWSDGVKAYYAPDRWSVVSRLARLGLPPGTVWNYNDYGPTMVGVILQRVTGQSLAQFAQEALFEPLGMPDPALFLLDSAEKGLEHAGAGFYGTARTLASFGQLYLNGGTLRGERIVSEAWVAESTQVRDSDSPALKNVRPGFFQAQGMSYKYFWWVRDRPEGPADFIAIGNLGQYVYVSPRSRMVAVRTGHDWGKFGTANWLNLLRQLVAPTDAA